MTLFTFIASLALAALFFMVLPIGLEYLSSQREYRKAFVQKRLSDPTFWKTDPVTRDLILEVGEWKIVWNPVFRFWQLFKNDKAVELGYDINSAVERFHKLRLVDPYPDRLIQITSRWK